MPSVRVSQWAQFFYSCMENVSIKWLRCTFLHILSICTNVNLHLCQKMHMCEMAMNSNHFGCMCVCVCVSVCLEDCSKSRPLCVLRLLHQTSSLDLLEPSAKIEESSQVKRSMKKPCYHQGRTAEQRSFSHLFEIRHAIQLFNLDASNPTLLWKYGAWVLRRDNGDNCGANKIWM